MWAGHGLAAAVPWAAGCSTPVALALSVACLATLPWALSGVPGPGCRVRGLRRVPAGWQARLQDGRWVPAEVTVATRVLPGLVVCGLKVAGHRIGWWVPRRSLPAAQFRRLKVAMRTGAPAGLARIGP